MLPRRCLWVGLAGAILAWGWQLLTVHYNYQDRWNALFCTGDRLRQPPQLADEHIYLFKNSTGYDGQVYHYIAHDPFFRLGLAPYTGAPRFRYRRILVPMAAYGLALGRRGGVDAAYYGVVLLAIFCGGWWLSLYCTDLGLSPWWGFGFLLLPATLVSIDRMTVDVALGALCAGYALFAARGSPRALYAVLVASPLVRETGFLLVAAYALYLAWKRNFRAALLFSTAAIPALAWYLFVQLHTTPYSVELFSLLPGSGWIERVLHPVHYPLAPMVAAVANVLDYAALAGIALAILLAMRMAFRRLSGPLEFGVYVFALAVMFVSARQAWIDAYAFGRGFTPLLLFLALAGTAKPSWMGAAPLLLVAPRILLQLAPQALGIVTAWR